MTDFVKTLSGVGRFFLPKEAQFYDLLNQGAGCVDKAGNQLLELCMAETQPDRDAIVVRLKDTEHESDAAIRNINAELNKTFVTPFDRGDILALAEQLEDLVNSCFSVAQCVSIHAMTDLPKGSIELAQLVQRSTVLIQAAVRLLCEPKKAEFSRGYCRHIKGFEKEGDAIFAAQLKELFSKEPDSILSFIKHREFLETLEDTLDLCSRTATVINTVLAKHM